MKIQELVFILTEDSMIISTLKKVDPNIIEPLKVLLNFAHPKIYDDTTIKEIPVKSQVSYPVPSRGILYFQNGLVIINNTAAHYTLFNRMPGIGFTAHFVDDGEARRLFQSPALRMSTLLKMWTLGPPDTKKQEKIDKRVYARLTPDRDFNKPNAIDIVLDNRIISIIFKRLKVRANRKFKNRDDYEGLVKYINFMEDLLLDSHRLTTKGEGLNSIYGKEFMRVHTNFRADGYNNKYELLKQFIDSFLDRALGYLQLMEFK